MKKELNVEFLLVQKTDKDECLKFYCSGTENNIEECRKDLDYSRQIVLRYTSGILSGISISNASSVKISYVYADKIGIEIKNSTIDLFQ